MSEVATAVSSKRAKENHITGFGSFPSDWEKRSITDCANIRDNERVPLNSSEREEKKPGDIPYYGANGIVDYINDYLFDAELILLAEDGGHFDEFQDRPVAYRISGKAWVNNHAHVLEAKGEVDTEYLFYSLEHRNLVPYVSGSTRSKLTKTMLQKVKVPVPPLDERRKIASVLLTVDRAIQTTEAIIAQAKRVKRGLMREIFTLGVDSDGRLRDPSKDPHLFQHTPLGKIPRCWEHITLGKVIDRSGGFIQTGPFGSQLHKEEYVVEGIPVVMPQNIENGYIREEEVARITQEKADDLSRHKMRPNDVIFARRGDLERAAAITEREKGWICGTGCLLVRPPKQEIDCRWLARFHQLPISQRQVLARAVGSTMLNLNQSILSHLQLALPPLEEQHRIVEVLSSIEAKMDLEVEKKDRLQRLKKSLMQDLLTGRVRAASKNIDVLDEVQAHG